MSRGENDVFWLVTFICYIYIDVTYVIIASIRTCVETMFERGGFGIWEVLWVNLGILGGSLWVLVCRIIIFSNRGSVLASISNLRLDNFLTI